VQTCCGHGVGQGLQQGSGAKPLTVGVEQLAQVSWKTPFQPAWTGSTATNPHQAVQHRTTRSRGFIGHTRFHGFGSKFVVGDAFGTMPKSLLFRPSAMASAVGLCDISTIIRQKLAARDEPFDFRKNPERQRHIRYIRQGRTWSRKGKNEGEGSEDPSPSFVVCR
jgi:hypothetical protein